MVRIPAVRDMASDIILRGARAFDGGRVAYDRDIKGKGCRLSRWLVELPRSTDRLDAQCGAAEQSHRHEVRIDQLSRNEAVVRYGSHRGRRRSRVSPLPERRKPSYRLDLGNRSAGGGFAG